jgi:hypothetical protein
VLRHGPGVYARARNAEARCVCVCGDLAVVTVGANGVVMVADGMSPCTAW